MARGITPRLLSMASRRKRGNMTGMPKLSAFLFTVLILLSALAQSSEIVDQLLASDTPPPGVVFDVDEWDLDALHWAIPQIRDYVDRLRARFPGIEMVVVSHGDEEFALIKSAKKDHASVHRQVKALVADQVSVQVCAGHAIMNGYSENSFVDFVEPVPEGVGALAKFQLRGFVYVPVKQPR